YNLQQSYLYVTYGKLWGHNKLDISKSPLFCIDENSNHITDIVGLPIDLLPMDDLQSISELLGDYASYGGDLTMASFANGGKFYTAINSPSLWRFENDIRLKQTFNDTIYTLSDSKIKPYLIFELGDWAWQYQDRLEEGGCEKKIMIDYALENERCIYFHFHTGFYTKNRQAFCGLYYKADHRVVLMCGDRLLDTVNRQSLRVRGVSSDGCFIALLQPDELCDEVKKKTGSKEEDNPIVVILE
ncbi:6-bladed beta-propeller, partial [Bacteroides fragilis]